MAEKQAAEPPAEKQPVKVPAQVVAPPAAAPPAKPAAPDLEIVLRPKREGVVDGTPLQRGQPLERVDVPQGADLSGLMSSIRKLV